MTRSLNRPAPVQVSDGASTTERVIFTEGKPVPLSRSRSVLRWAIRHHLMIARFDPAAVEERAPKRDPHVVNARLAHRQSYLEDCVMARAMDRL